ncbi:MAG: four helix bundle protein [Roseiflexaceae bacterium]
MANNYTHRNLIVWQRAQELGYQVSKLTQHLPQNWTNAILARQIIRAATSVGANIAEGHGRYTPGAHRNHLLIARGSLAETDSWLDQLRRGGHITTAEEAPLLSECGEITAMLTKKILMLDKLLSEGGVSHLREERETYDIYDGKAPDLPPFPFLPEDYL